MQAEVQTQFDRTNALKQRIHSLPSVPCVFLGPFRAGHGVKLPRRQGRLLPEYSRPAQRTHGDVSKAIAVEI